MNSSTGHSLDMSSHSEQSPTEDVLDILMQTEKVQLAARDKAISLGQTQKVLEMTEGLKQTREAKDAVAQGRSPY